MKKILILLTFIFSAFVFTKAQASYNHQKLQISDTKILKEITKATLNLSADSITIVVVNYGWHQDWFSLQIWAIDNSSYYYLPFPPASTASIKIPAGSYYASLDSNVEPWRTPSARWDTPEGTFYNQNVYLQNPIESDATFTVYSEPYEENP